MLPKTKLPRPPEHLKHEVEAGQVRVSVHGRFMVVKNRSSGHFGTTDNFWLVRDGDPDSLKTFEMSDDFIKGESWLVGYTGNEKLGKASLLYDQKNHPPRAVLKRWIVSAHYSEDELKAGPIDFTISTLNTVYSEPGWTAFGVNGGSSTGLCEKAAKAPTRAAVPPDYYPTEPGDRPMPSPLITCPLCSGTGGDAIGALCRACRGSGSIPRDALGAVRGMGA